MNPGFWQGKHVFLTGHTGFKGCWLSVWLTNMGVTLTGYALAPNTSPSLFDLIGSQISMTSVIGDIRDREALSKAMHAANPDIIIHMAAQPLVRESYQNPVETYDINVMGTVHLLEVARSLPNLESVVVVTTDKVYENQESEAGYGEKTPLGGSDPYASSKACAELVTMAYRQSFFETLQAHVATARAGNVIGGGDWAQDRLIPDMVRAFSQNKPLTLRYPQAIRPWQHVLEPLAGYLVLAERLVTHGDTLPTAWNFGPRPADMWPVGEIVEKAASVWGQSAQVQLETAPQPHETGILRLNSSQAETRLGWQPQLTVEEALALTMTWYKHWAQGATPQALFEETRNQILAYQHCIIPTLVTP